MPAVDVRAISADQLIVRGWPFERKLEIKQIPGTFWSRDFDPPGWLVSVGEADHLKALLRTVDGATGAEVVEGAGQVLAEALRAASAATASVAPVVMAPGRMRRPLWEHQGRAVAAAEARWSAGRPGMLWHMAMGSGKSAAGAAIIDRAGVARTLILCPKSVVAVWPRELADALVNVPTIYKVEGSLQKRLDLIEKAGRTPHCVLVANYECIRSLAVTHALADQHWDLLIMDESHRLKAPSGSDQRAVYSLAKRIPRRLGLTGTPMPHSPLDIFAQARILDDAVLGTTKAGFVTKFARTGGYGGKEIVGWNRLDELAGRLAGMTFTAGADVLDLPDIHHVDVDVTLGPAERAAYIEMFADGVINLADTGAGLDGTVSTSSVLAELIRLAQITGGSTGGAKVIEDGYLVERLEPVELGTAKQDRLEELVSDAGIHNGDPMIVFCRFRHSLDAVERVAAKLGLEYGELSGRRRDGIDGQAYATAGLGLIGVQYQSGGVGIDLTRSANVVCFDQHWSLGDFDQAMKRAHRPGQTRPVTVFHLLAGYVSRGDYQPTIDHRIRRAINARRSFVESVMEQVESARGAA